MRVFRRVVLPALVVVGGFAVAALLIATGPEVQVRPSRSVAPLVRVIVVDPKTVRLTTETHGTVVPRTESELVPEVAGRVLEVSPSLVSGGFFEAGDVLLKIDPMDHEVALEQARAGRARAESDLANARRAHARQLDLVRRQATSDSQRDDALNRVRIAEATLREAVARLARAERDLARTEVRAPYDGRVRTERVDVGQFVNRGAMVATIYAVDFAEVRLPIHDEELKFLRLPLMFNDDQSGPGIPVTLRARFAGEQHEWQGEVVRTEGELDPTTRMVNVVARIPEPYARRDGRPPLAVGLFVDVEIQGAVVDNVVVLPRSALRGDGRVLTIDADDRLRFRDVEVLRLSRDDVYISAGLRRGERVCVSALQTTADGMQVRLIEQSADPEQTREFGS